MLSSDGRHAADGSAFVHACQRDRQHVAGNFRYLEFLKSQGVWLCTPARHR